MKAPDKIYTDNRGVYAELPIFSQADANVEYIRKEAIRDEIERRRDFFYERYVKKGIGCIEESRYDECVEILSFIDSLPDCTVKTDGQGRVKDDVYDSLTDEQPEDFNDAFDKYMKEEWSHGTQLNDIARHFYELGRQSKKK